MPWQQITNPRGAFGYTTADLNRGNLEYEWFVNVSSGSAIAVGNAVVFSTNSSQGKGVAVTSGAGAVKFCGIALTSCAAGQSTNLSSNAPTSQLVLVALRGGPVMARLDTATVNGDLVGYSSIAGQLGPYVASTVAGTQSIAGMAHTSGSTVDEAGTTQASRGLVTLRPSFVSPSTL